MADAGADSQVSNAQYRFLFQLNEAGGKVAYDNDLPVPAMLACAAAESGWRGALDRCRRLPATGVESLIRTWEGVRCVAT